MTELGRGKSCFVIGPIGDRHAREDTEARTRFEQAMEVLDRVIFPACAAVGLTPVRADMLDLPGEIPEQVMVSLHDADVVIADLTGGNPNVMYELGLRHSRNKLTVQIGEKSNLPFDVAAINTVLFQRAASSWTDAAERLGRLLKSGLAGQGGRTTAERVWAERREVTDMERLLSVLDEQIADEPEESVRAALRAERARTRTLHKEMLKLRFPDLGRIELTAAGPNKAISTPPEEGGE